MVQLSQLVKGVQVTQVCGDIEREVTSIAYDSRQIKEGGAFVAINGFHQDGNSYIPEALTNGARSIISENKMDRSIESITWIQVENCRHALATVSDRFYDHPSGKLDLVGITGTNGKTTVTYLADAILSAAHYTVGVIGTIQYRYAGQVWPARQTTPESLDLQRLLHDMWREQVNCCVFEVSSHSLALDRVQECDFRVGVFTNLGQDHLDFHKTTEGYFKEKLKLFTAYPMETAVVNNDDPYGERIAKETAAALLTYGITQSADIMATDIEMDAGGAHFIAKTPIGDIPIHSKLVGVHNVYNTLAGIGIGIAKGITVKEIEYGIKSVESVPGRFEPVDEGQDFLVAVDYAHTEDALRQVLSMAREITTSNLITVFGCGGERDTTKRPLMGKTVAMYSDYSIITSDNPRRESPKKIIREIETGVTEVVTDQSTYAIVEDRREAIIDAINAASTGDVVVIAGKGHEDYQIIGEKRIHFDDREVAREALRKKLGIEGLRN